MKTVLAALDDSPTARPVLEVALGLAGLLDARVEAIHVTDGPGDIAVWLAEQHGVPLQRVRGPEAPALLGAVEHESVVAAVFGARKLPGGRRPAGRTAIRVLEGATKPIAVVPPDLAGGTRHLRRVLVPLEGGQDSAEPVLDRLCPLLVADAELIVLHVFTASTVPRALDRSGRDLSLWGEEFVARYLPLATRIELRSGPVGVRVIEVTQEEEADLVVLSWSKTLAPGHAAVVREVLGLSTVPVLLIPTDGPVPLRND